MWPRLRPAEAVARLLLPALPPGGVADASDARDAWNGPPYLGGKSKRCTVKSLRKSSTKSTCVSPPKLARPSAVSCDRGRGFRRARLAQDREFRRCGLRGRNAAQAHSRRGRRAVTPRARELIADAVALLAAHGF